MRRTLEGRIIYDPGDRIKLVAGESERILCTILHPAKFKEFLNSDGKIERTEHYQVRLSDGSKREVSALQIWKEADSGGYGKVVHI